MRGIIIILSVMLVMPAFGQRNRRGDDDAQPDFTEGITYALPRTGVRVHVKAMKETFEPGPYASYADQLLGISNARTSANVKWHITDVKLETFTEPDPDQVYKAMGDAAFLVSLTPEGCLAGINSSGKSTPGDVKTNRYIEKPEKDDGFSFDHINDTPVYAEGDSANNFRPVRVGSERKAGEAAERILEARLTRYWMAAGLMDEFHPDGTAYEVSLRELKRIEKQYLSLFEGRTTYQNEKFSFDFIPTSSSERGEVVFRFSEENGVLSASNLSGKPVNVQVDVNESLSGKYGSLAESENPSAGESGVYYRLPVISNVKIVFDTNTIASARIPLAQFGKTAPVPEGLLTGEYAIEFHPETGAIRSVSKE